MQRSDMFDIAVRELKLKLLHMGGDIQEATRQSVAALQARRKDQSAEIIRRDAQVNQEEHDIEDLCIRIIATHHPVSTDLRKIVSGMRIASDLERMGDLAVDIAKATLRLGDDADFLALPHIADMADVVDHMISDALTAYAENNVDLAAQLAAADDEVDQLYRGVVETLFQVGTDASSHPTQAMTLSFVGRSLERIADHATNIGESVLYIVSGERIDLN